jgi:transposase
MGQRSSRAIERECVEDIAYRVIAANRKPDHATLARFVVRHEAAVAELFGEVLSLCADAGMVKVGVVAIDGTKVHANASQHGRDSNPRWTETLIPVFESVAVGGWSASTPRPLGSLRALSGRQSCTP